MCIAGGGLILPFHVAGSWSEQKEGFFPPKFAALRERKGLRAPPPALPAALSSGHPKAVPLQNHRVPGAKGEGGRKKKPSKGEKAAHQRAESVSGQRPGGAAGAYLQLGLNLPRFPPGKNLQVARDLQRESRRGEQQSRQPEEKKRKEKGLPMLRETPPGTPGHGRQRTLMPTWYSRTFFRARTWMWLDT